MPAEKYSYSKVSQIHQELLNERSEWEQEWRNISQFLIPGRGIFQTLSKPRKRELTSSKVINSIAEDALSVLTSGLHSRLSSPAVPWFRLGWANPAIQANPGLLAWLQDSEKRLNQQFHASNFYSIINSFYTEYAGFGTAALFVEEIFEDDSPPFQFHLLTAGEYSFAMGATGTPSVFVRTIFMSPRQVVERYPDTASENLKRRVNNSEAGADITDLSVLEFVIKDDYKDKSYYRILYEAQAPTRLKDALTLNPLMEDGFYEHPYIVSRWGTIGSDTYGIGPGARALPDIKRLQNVEKSMAVAIHKELDPPLNAPAHLKGTLNSLPGAKNYYSNPQQVVTKLYQMDFDYQGANLAIDRIEQRIQRNFFNDVFLTASRDPDSSPLKATQVIAQQQEQLFRLGPTVERLQHECFMPLIRRAFNVMERREMFLPLSPELREAAGDFEITIISPMAVAQRQAKTQGTDAFMAFIAQASQFDQTILDNLDSDEAALQKADTEGVDLGVLRTREEVARIRKVRQEQLQAARQKDEQAQIAAGTSALDKETAEAQKAQAEAGLAQAEIQQITRDIGF